MARVQVENGRAIVRPLDLGFGGGRLIGELPRGKAPPSRERLKAAYGRLLQADRPGRGWLRIRPKITYKRMRRSGRVASGKVSFCGRLPRPATAR